MICPFDQEPTVLEILRISVLCMWVVWRQEKPDLHQTKHYFILSCFISTYIIFFLLLRMCLLFWGFCNIRESNRKGLRLFQRQIGKSLMWAAGGEGRVFRLCVNIKCWCFFQKSTDIYWHTMCVIHFVEVETNEQWTMILKGKTIMNVFNMERDFIMILSLL